LVKSLWVRFVKRKLLTNCLWLFAIFSAGCTASELHVLTLQPPQVRTSKPAESEFIPTADLPTPFGFLTHTPVYTPLPSFTATATATPNPYVAWSIESLKTRQYGEGELRQEEVLAQNSYFTRILFSYPSDNLQIFGFMNIPVGEGPFPVVIALHGYIDPQVYTTLDYTTRYADDLARRGFLVLHPNLRNYPPSDTGENLFRVGMAVDVLNLVGLVNRRGGLPGLLEKANPEQIGLWGHSMGGGISTRVITVTDLVDGVVLYAAMSGDEIKNYQAIYEWSDGLRGLEELSVPQEALLQISPEYYFDEIQAAVSIHHGQADELVPVEWSENTCAQLKDKGKNIECLIYPGMPHTFYGDDDLAFMDNVAQFFLRVFAQ
jgi:uncharacterized protein